MTFEMKTEARSEPLPKESNMLVATWTELENMADLVSHNKTVSWDDQNEKQLFFNNETLLSS